MKKQDARVRYTVKVLKEALLKLLEQKPVNKITVKEVCELAELNRATFYTHFSDCFDLLESIETDFIAEFESSLKYAESFDVSMLVSAIYDMVDNNERVCRVLVFGNTNSALIKKMIAIARERSLAYWRQTLKKASEDELAMLYTHLSNGLLHVVVEGYSRYDKAKMIKFVNTIVQSNLSVFA